MKVCLNCRFYDPAAQWECRESIAEPVRDKGRANFCDFFALRPGGPGAGPGASSDPNAKSEAARDSLRKLFGDG